MQGNEVWNGTSTTVPGSQASDMSPDPINMEVL